MKGESLVLVLVLIFLLMACGAFLLSLGSTHPRQVYVDADQAFVYPEGERFLLALEDGPYQVSGTRLLSGCYELEHGQARLIGATCPEVN